MADETAEEFLARTKGGGAPDAADAFLRRTKGVGMAVAKPEAPGWTTDPLSGLEIPPEGTSAAAPSIPAFIRRIGSATAQAYQETPPILTPRGQELVDRMGVLGPTIYNPLLHILGGAPAAINALAAGTGQAVGEVTGHPELGRDVTQALPLLPLFHNPHPGFPAQPNALEYPPGPTMTAPGPQFPASLPRILELTQNPEAPRSPAFIPPNEPHPGPTLAPVSEVPVAAPRPAFIPPEGAPESAPESAPGSVGAAGTPKALSNLTPEQAAEYGSVADKQWLYKSLPPGEADTTEYIPGISPTMAQREQTTKAAREQKAARNLSPAADQAERELLAEHNVKRKDFFAETAGSDVTQGIAMREAEAKIEKGLQAAYAHGGTVDLQPVIDATRAELVGSAGKLPPVKAAMQEIVDAAQKPEGGLETDPRQANAVRRAIIYMQSKQGRLANPGYGSPDVMAALTRVKDVLTKQIEPAAPGFTEAIANYSDARRAIDAQEALQAAEPKLLDAQGNMQFARFHKFMGDVIKSRDPNAPMNAYQSLTEAQMNRLKSLHDDLMRVATADDLAKARGSDTAPNLIDMAKHALQGIPGSVAAAVAGHAALGPLGAVFGPVAKGTVENMFSRGAERRATRRMQDYLQPDPSKFPMKPNPLLMEGPDNPLQAPP